MSAGLLVRVGIDGESGKWNAPCDSAGKFCFVPMGYAPITTSFDPLYLPYKGAVDDFLSRSSTKKIPRRCKWPTKLPQKGHFDPDFNESTYGDQGQKAERIQSLMSPGDFLVFYSALRSVETGKLIYSIIGFYVVDRVLHATKVPKRDRHRNEHTRPGRFDPAQSCVVFGRPRTSGRLTRHIPIGEMRGKHYWVTKELLQLWGGLDVKDGFIHRSAYLPMFLKPKRFLRWFDRQDATLIHEDNPSEWKVALRDQAPVRNTNVEDLCISRRFSVK